MSKNGIAVKGTMDFESVVSFLEDLLASFKQKTVCVQRGDEFVTLAPGDNIEMELEAVEKKGKQKLTLELEWQEELDAEEAIPFRVTAKEPEPKPEEKAEEKAEGPCETKDDKDDKTPAKAEDKAPAKPAALAPKPADKPAAKPAAAATAAKK